MTWDACTELMGQGSSFKPPTVKYCGPQPCASGVTPIQRDDLVFVESIVRLERNIKYRMCQAWSDERVSGSSSKLCRNLGFSETVWGPDEVFGYRRVVGHGHQTIHKRTAKRLMMEGRKTDVTGHRRQVKNRGFRLKDNHQMRNV